MRRINIIYEHSQDWILARLARALVAGIPGARGVDYGSKEIQDPQVKLNYYMNLRTGFKRKTKALDVGFLDHREPQTNELVRAALLDHVVVMAPQYQRELWAKGIDTSLIVQPTDTAAYTPAPLVLGWCGKWTVGTYDQYYRKGAELINRASRLPFVELRQTDGKIPDEEMPNWYRGLDYVIATERYGGGPMCLTEALACGKRVIMPLTVGVAELFSDGVINYNAGDADSLCAVLEALWQEKKRLSDMISGYTWEKWVERHERLFTRLIEGQPILEARPMVERAIVVVATPDIEEITRHTLPAIEAYAKKCKAEMIVLRDVPAEYQHPKYCIMRMRDINARRVLHLDADTRPKPDAPDIFDEHPPGAVYAWDESECRLQGKLQPFRKQIEKHTGEEVEWPVNWWNPGVMLCDFEHLHMFEMPPWNVQDAEHLYFGDTVKNQPWINYRIAKLGIPVKPMNRKYNTITSLPTSDVDNAYILHFGAENIPDAGKRKIEMAEAYAIMSDRRVLMATVVSGAEYEALYSLIEPYHSAYAARHGYDYKVIRKPKRNDWPSPSWWKLELAEELGHYDAVVFVDADAWPWQDAPCIVSATRPGTFAAFNSAILPYMIEPGSHAQTSYRRWCNDSGNEYVQPERYINAGLWVCWKQAKPVLECETPVESTPYFEQHQVNYNLAKQPGLYCELAREWNYGHLGVQANRDAAMKAYIPHLNGVGVSVRATVFNEMKAKRNAREATAQPWQQEKQEKPKLPRVHGVRMRREPAIPV